jgi:hypothetical protein
LRAQPGRSSHERQRASEVPRHSRYPSAAPRLGALFPRGLVRRRQGRAAPATCRLRGSAVASWRNVADALMRAENSRGWRSPPCGSRIGESAGAVEREVGRTNVGDGNGPRFFPSLAPPTRP